MLKPFLNKVLLSQPSKTLRYYTQDTKPCYLLNQTWTHIPQMALKCQQNTRVQIFHSFTVLLKLLNINIIITNKSLFLEQNTYCCTVDLYRCFTIHKFHSEVAAQQFNIDRFLFRDDNANHHIHLSVIFKHTSFFHSAGAYPKKSCGNRYSRPDTLWLPNQQSQWTVRNYFWLLQGSTLPNGLLKFIHKNSLIDNTYYALIWLKLRTWENEPEEEHT